MDNHNLHQLQNQSPRPGRRNKHQSTSPALASTSTSAADASTAGDPRGPAMSSSTDLAVTLIALGTNAAAAAAHSTSTLPASDSASAVASAAEPELSSTNPALSTLSTTATNAKASGKAKAKAKRAFGDMVAGDNETNDPLAVDQPCKSHKSHAHAKPATDVHFLIGYATPKKPGGWTPSKRFEDMVEAEDETKEKDSCRRVLFPRSPRFSSPACSPSRASSSSSMSFQYHPHPPPPPFPLFSPATLAIGALASPLGRVDIHAASSSPAPTNGSSPSVPRASGPHVVGGGYVYKGVAGGYVYKGVVGATPLRNVVSAIDEDELAATAADVPKKLDFVGMARRDSTAVSSSSMSSRAQPTTVVTVVGPQTGVHGEAGGRMAAPTTSKVPEVDETSASTYALRGTPQRQREGTGGFRYTR